MEENEDWDAPARLRHSTGFLLVWVAPDSSERYARALASVELNAYQVGVLSLVQDTPMPQSRLSERLRIFKPVMVAVLRDLEEQGLVQRRPHPTDGCALVVHLALRQTIWPFSRFMGGAFEFRSVTVLGVGH